jgi:hypothetical protein
MINDQWGRHQQPVLVIGTWSLVIPHVALVVPSW